MWHSNNTTKLSGCWTEKQNEHIVLKHFTKLATESKSDEYVIISTMKFENLKTTDVS